MNLKAKKRGMGAIWSTVKLVVQLVFQLTKDEPYILYIGTRILTNPFLIQLYPPQDNLILLSDIDIMLKQAERQIPAYLWSVDTSRYYYSLLYTLSEIPWPYALSFEGKLNGYIDRL